MQGQADGTSSDSVIVSEAYAAARDLLRQAESDAERIRADADRYLRQREQEAELLVGKARRLLEMAEERSVSMSNRASGAGRLDGAAAVAPPVVDLDPDEGDLVEPGTRSAGRDLDSILASSVSRAIHRALATEA